MNEPLAYGGVFFLFIGLVLLILSGISGERQETKFSVVGLIGFIPFGVANDRRLFFVTLAFTLLMAALVFWLQRP